VEDEIVVLAAVEEPSRRVFGIDFDIHVAESAEMWTSWSRQSLSG
jgi:hypothetical protein